MVSKCVRLEISTAIRLPQRLGKAPNNTTPYIVEDPYISNIVKWKPIRGIGDRSGY